MMVWLNGYTQKDRHMSIELNNNDLVGADAHIRPDFNNLFRVDVGIDPYIFKFLNGIKL